MIGQVSGEDAKPSGQRVTERGRLSHPADLAKTDETISNSRPGQFFNPSRILCLRAAFHNISNLNSPFPLLHCGGEATARGMFSNTSGAQRYVMYSGGNAYANY